MMPGEIASVTNGRPVVVKEQNDFFRIGGRSLVAGGLREKLYV
jgi:hypothetical protein